jgi:hypothetical protein
MANDTAKKLVMEYSWGCNVQLALDTRTTTTRCRRPVENAAGRLLSSTRWIHHFQSTNDATVPGFPRVTFSAWKVAPQRCTTKTTMLDPFVWGHFGYAPQRCTTTKTTLFDPFVWGHFGYAPQRHLSGTSAAPQRC